MSRQPPRDCPLCPRLAAFREENRAAYPDYFNDPVPTFSGDNVRLLIVGLAPGLHGANQTGRPFTGDWAGDLLYATLLRHGLARGPYLERADDGLASGLGVRFVAMARIQARLVRDFCIELRRHTLGSLLARVRN